MVSELSTRRLRKPTGAAHLAVLCLGAVLVFGSVEAQTRKPEPGPPQLPPEFQPIVEYVKKVEASSEKTNLEALDYRVTFVDDPYAFIIAKTFLDEWPTSGTKRRALRRAHDRLKKFKRKKGQAGVFVQLGNRDFRATSGSRQIFTFHGKFPGSAFQVTSGDRKQRIATKLAAPPRNLRATALRVKKFFRRSGGGFRQPILSKPEPALVFDAKSASLLLTLSSRRVNRLNEVRVGIASVKSYKGPFESDQIDLNSRFRTWDALEPASLSVPIPGEPVPQPAALAALIKEFEER